MGIQHLRPPWQPGQSGNPHGVHSGTYRLAALIRKETGGGETLVKFFLAVAAGEAITRPGGKVQRPTLEHSLTAAQWLADRGWGKAKEIIELTSDHETTPEERLALLRRLTDEERATLRQILAKALAGGAADASNGSGSDGEGSDLGARGDELPPRDDASPSGSGPAPAVHGQPRNVGRAVAQALELPDPELASPAEAPALAPDSPPLPPD